MDELINVRVRSNPNESDEQFSARLSGFWTHFLRTYPDEFESVYAERCDFERTGDVVTRDYLAEESVLELLESEFRGRGVDYEPIDRYERFSKYEATAPEWMQIEH